jgi:ABC-type dipeptide/oligopeptide/nickel transport system permease subunit
MDVKQERKRNTIIGLVLAVGSFAIIQGLIMAGVIRSYQMVTVATICINIIGDNLRDVMDPKSDRSR